MRTLQEWYGRRSLWSRRLIVSLLAISIVLGGLWFTPTPYYITAPGAAVDTGRIINVEGGKLGAGRLYLLSLVTTRANLLLYLWAQVDPRADLETREEFLGPVKDYATYIRIHRETMSNSQRTAKAIALQLTGYGAGVRSVGAKVLDLVEHTPAREILSIDDVVIEADGRTITSAEDFINVVAGVAPGGIISMRVRRGAQELQLKVPTVEHPERKGAAMVGVQLGDSLIFDEPIPVGIRSGYIIGPSAGLIFTLQIIDQLSPQGITGGRRIAGTGTIEREGRVGAIGGVEQKVFTAESAGADVIFVPQANYADAQRVATRIIVVPIDNVRDALAWLKANPNTAAASRE
jgi:PDZ domain-containing protein